MSEINIDIDQIISECNNRLANNLTRNQMIYLEHVLDKVAKDITQWFVTADIGLYPKSRVSVTGLKTKEGVEAQNARRQIVSSSDSSWRSVAKTEVGETKITEKVSKKVTPHNPENTTDIRATQEVKEESRVIANENVEKKMTASFNKEKLEITTNQVIRVNTVYKCQEFFNLYEEQQINDHSNKRCAECPILQCNLENYQHTVNILNNTIEKRDLLIGELKKQIFELSTMPRNKTSSNEKESVIKATRELLEGIIVRFESFSDEKKMAFKKIIGCYEDILRLKHTILMVTKKMGKIKNKK